MAGTLAALFVAAEVLDHWIFAHVAFPAVYDRGWGRMLRVFGYVPAWAIGALALGLHDARKAGHAAWPGARRGVLLFVSVSVAGLAAEALKLLLRRERPGLTGGVHVMRAWSDQPFSSAQLGLPSSEVAVAFAGAAMLARMFPEASVLWYGVAIGCGLTRVAAEAHFASDIVLGALVGYVVTVWFSPRSENIPK